MSLPRLEQPICNPPDDCDICLCMSPLTAASLTRIAQAAGNPGYQPTPKTVDEAVHRWSVNWPHCQVCGTTATRHYAFGRCANCYARAYQSRKRRAS